jgi:Ca2+-binding RTX toxin-like protein
VSAARAAGLAVACLAALPATASGATVKIVVRDSCNGDLACSKYAAGFPVPVVTYLAAGGEANRVAVARTGDIVTISDLGVAIAAEAPCLAVDSHHVACAASSGTTGIAGFDAQLGDGDDTLAIAGGLGTTTRIDGGDGSDGLSGGEDEDTLAGGLGADRLDGRDGHDNLSFSARPDGVVVDFASGRSSDGDVFSRMEQATGGDGADRLLGGPGAETLYGRNGADTVRGRGGDDLIFADLGPDLVEGGGGDDMISGDPVPGDGYYSPTVRLSRDVLRGGAGDDTIVDTGGDNVIEGGAGIDNLRGGAGRDAIRGGAGRDRISARDGRRDRVDCGSGRDRARIDKKDRVRACEMQRPRRYTAER